MLLSVFSADALAPASFGVQSTIEARKLPMRDAESDPDPKGFDFGAPAELFAGRTKRGPIRYHRFETAAEAIRYSVEDLAPVCLLSSFIEVGAIRLDGKGIERLYRGPQFPLQRRNSHPG